MKKTTLALALLLSAAVPAQALAKEVAGVNVPEELSVEGKSLHLNGAGIRKKFIIKVYVGALYLASPATTLSAITGADQPRTIHMHFLRSVDKEKILGAFKEGFEKNSKDKLPVLLPGLEKLSGGVIDMKEGSVLVVSYAPGKGTTVGVKGGTTVTVEGKDFADALLRNWIGDEPADKSLKEAMLAGGK